jgi:hypothetical protein
MIIPSLTSFVPLGIVCGFYGFFTGSYISQKSVIIVDLLGPVNGQALGFNLLPFYMYAKYIVNEQICS